MSNNSKNNFKIMGAKLVTPSADGQIIEFDNAVIDIESGIITSITALKNANASRIGEDGATLINAKDCLITPTLTDCHTHLTFAGNRAAEFARRLLGETYQSIAQSGGGIQSTVRATRAATLEELTDLTKSRLQSWLAHGVGTVEIKSGYGLNFETEEKILHAIHEASRDFPGDVVATFLGAHTIPPEATGQSDRYVDDICAMIEKLAPKGLIQAVDAYCESIAFTTNQVKKVFQCAQLSGLPIKIHAEQLSNSGGAECAAGMGALSCDHLEYLDDDGVNAMANSGSVAVLLPGAFFYLKESKKPPVESLRKAGVPMAIGTDYNPGTSPVRSLLIAAQWAALLFGLSIEECFLGITLHASRALGRPPTESMIQVGQKARLAIWNCQSLPELFYECGDNPCQGCFIGDDWHPSSHSFLNRRFSEQNNHVTYRNKRG